MAAYSVMNLQTTLAAANPPTDSPTIPHHPISCRDELLWLDEEGRFGCEHGEAPPGDVRTQFCIDNSIAILLIELLTAWEAQRGCG